MQINVNGTIGDKLTIAADWNTERTFEYENQLKLHYKGYEDEIIQSIEAGNVSLQTSPLVGGGEALFGIKALFQFGPFTLTALASQKKSEVEEVLFPVVLRKINLKFMLMIIRKITILLIWHMQMKIWIYSVNILEMLIQLSCQNIKLRN